MSAVPPSEADLQEKGGALKKVETKEGGAFYAMPAMARRCGSRSRSRHRQESSISAAFAVRRRITSKQSASDVSGKREDKCSASASATGKAQAAGVDISRKAPLHTLVINLKRRPDRWKAVSTRLEHLPGSRNQLFIERLAATDGLQTDVPLSVVASEWTTDRNAKYDGRAGAKSGVRLRLSPGERGCAMSHVKAWRMVASQAVGTDIQRPTLVLEDDAVLGKRFLERLSLTVKKSVAAPGGVDVVYLGYIKGAPWRCKVANGLYEAEYLWTTVGYLLWPSGAKKLLAALPVDQPVDNFMAWEIASRRLRAFAVHPPMVDQQDEWDCKSDVPHSDDLVIDGR